MGFRHAMLEMSYDEAARLDLLPAGTKVLGVSPHVLFSSNQMAVKVEHLALPETPEAACMPILSGAQFKALVEAA